MSQRGTLGRVYHGNVRNVTVADEKPGFCGVVWITLGGKDVFRAAACSKMGSTWNSNILNSKIKGSRKPRDRCFAN